ncbi:MAG: N-acetylmuramoyl-L-alanine amidase [Candidatus Abyssobacteria bacterium SURF_5]|uniref:N-acetylmuramoyl-L-alanine amidase n=1 Tax=Abyssobacteria bacterium (strain SURF_5) TaxID=2093360 RepID=A0A3A4NC58_ABYX5|nr:MAG: N-acetylmuramoyl-L-alanine amidase [Candidatus Abyssubacteria bacterium SURF_5]
MYRKDIHPYLLCHIGWLMLFSLILIAPTTQVYAAVETSLEPGLTVSLGNDNEIAVKACPTGDYDLQEWVDRLLANPETCQKLIKGDCLHVPLEDLTPEYQLEAVKALFPNDSHTEEHWIHKVTYVSTRAIGGETLWSMSKWFTGNAQNHTKISAYNKMSPRKKLYKNSIVKIPVHLLSPAFRDMITFEIAARRTAEGGAAKLKQLNGELVLKMDSQGPYASYRMKRGDTIYSKVVMQFTDRVTAEDVMEATKLICERSGIRDPRRLKKGDEIKIPLDLLSVMYLPPDDPRRVEYERLQKEADRYSNPIQTEDLKGIIVILDPGHGGNDPGTIGRIGHNRVYEDEIVYDITCRVKHILETTTLAKVEMTLQDKSENYGFKDVSYFQNDHDEYVLTNPVYRNHDAKVSANLRWYLANSIFRKVTKAGADPDKVVFVSFHADSLHPDARGTMIYIPSTYLCSGNGGKTGIEYTSRAEVRESQYVQISYKNRVRSEGLSGDLAKQIIRSLHDEGIGIHPAKPIRNQVIKRRHAYVPAVIRHNIVPVKILVEVVNLNNSDDCKLVNDPKFRDKFAHAFVQALKHYYGDK